MDYLGHLPKEKYVFAMTDQRSRYPIVLLTNSTLHQTFKIFNSVFSHYGSSMNIVSDKGLIKTSIKHQKITPLWPKANSEIEQLMRPLMKVNRVVYIEILDHGFTWIYISL